MRYLTHNYVILVRSSIGSVPEFLEIATVLENDRQTSIRHAYWETSPAIRFIGYTVYHISYTIR